LETHGGNILISPAHSRQRLGGCRGGTNDYADAFDQIKGGALSGTLKGDLIKTTKLEKRRGHSRQTSGKHIRRIGADLRGRWGGPSKSRKEPTKERDRRTFVELISVQQFNLCPPTW